MQHLLRSRKIQLKLAISSPDDVYEQEADRVADQVMRMSDPRLQRQMGPEEEEEEEPIQAKRTGSQDRRGARGLASPTGELRGGGQPLSRSEREFFEPRFGCDFSSVRVHTGREAAETAGRLQARAFVSGRNIVFGAGWYTPKTAEGRHLLGHELTHVIQQQAGGGRERPNSAYGRSVATNARSQPVQLAREDEARYLARRYGTRRRGVITFIMGTDVGGFYDYAKEYWSARQRTDRVVDSARTFAEIITYLRDGRHRPLFNKPWGEINIVVHGSELGIYMPIRPGTQRGTTIRSLRTAINENAIRALPDTIVDARTNINLHGCEIGQNKKLMRLISLAFGGADRQAPRVYAPKVYIGYGEGKRPGTYYEALKPEFHVVLPSKHAGRARRALWRKYRWLPARQKRVLRRRPIVWEPVAYDDSTASATPRSRSLPRVRAEFNQVRLPRKHERKKHARIVRRFHKQRFDAYLSPPKGKTAGMTKSFDVHITKTKLLGNKIRYNVTYVFFEWQQLGKKKWKNPQGRWVVGVAGDRGMPRNWQAGLRAWVGRPTYRQYRWKLESEQRQSRWFGSQYNLTATGLGFKATVAGITMRNPRRSWSVFGRYRPKSRRRRRR
jgi:hypothetical protein